MYGCENVGNIFPAKEDDVSAFYDMNPINSQEERSRHYHQLELKIERESDGIITSKADDSIQVSLYRYINSLLEENG